MTDQDTYSRLISWLKIALPLLALAILSTLFLVARRINPEDAIPYANVDVEDRLREPRMTAPTYAGVTSDGSALSFSATEARPEGNDTGSGSATGLTGLLETPDGGHADLAAAKARIDGPGRKIDLSGGVTIASSTGWTMESETLTAQMDMTDIETLNPVTATGPAGTVTANAMHITRDTGKQGGYLLVFNGAVKLIYQPAN